MPAFLRIAAAVASANLAIVAGAHAASLDRLPVTIENRPSAPDLAFGRFEPR
ncbi:hypothetical protein [Salinarimonas chemoclinalis]|uniref:hypothetical protein n=1 Tax=Salinarimonas chemoclinalis TaxID=3241599 RepID=UPI003558CD91